MNCEYCGAAIPAGAGNCPSCGAAVTVQAPQAPVLQPAQPQPGYAPQPGYVAPMTPPPRGIPGQKSRAAYVLLAVFLGPFGVHNFYADRVTPALIQLIVGGVIGLLTCGMTAIPVWIWAIVECFIVKTDGRGTPFE